MILRKKNAKSSNLKSTKMQDASKQIKQNLPRQNLPFCTLESSAFETKIHFRNAIKSHIKSNPKISTKSNAKSTPKSHIDSTPKSSPTPRTKDYKISYANRHLNALLEKILSQKRFRNILLYYPLPFEANILPLLKKLKKNKNKRIFLPTIKGLNFKMLLYRLPLVKNTLGIFEPHISSYMPRNIDFALIPALGIDRDFARIGMGKGMYDRVFATHPHNRYKTQKICKIFVSQNLYISKRVLGEAFDIRANMYLSYKFGKSQKKGFNNVVDTFIKFFRFRGVGRSGGIFCLPKNR
ncbi:5-formyltetrahydrofolate cyclo-ligase [Helicobacter sp. T3_23-1056]